MACQPCVLASGKRRSGRRATAQRLAAERPSGRRDEVGARQRREAVAQREVASRARAAERREERREGIERRLQREGEITVERVRPAERHAVELARGQRRNEFYAAIIRNCCGAQGGADSGGHVASEKLSAAVREKPYQTCTDELWERTSVIRGVEVVVGARCEGAVL